MDSDYSARVRLTGARRVVVKVGTNVLTAGGDRLDLAIMAGIVDQIARQVAAGREMLLVSSGAVAAGRRIVARLEGPARGSVPMRQVLASVGQSRLMAAYDELFAWHDLVVAQALLTKDDLVDRQRYLNARTTLLALLDLGVIPIVNENDVVAVEELRNLTFGDNDSLSALVATLVDADALVILTDTEGLFTADPTADSQATLVPFVPRVNDAIESMAGGSLSGRGLGGMQTKVRAAKLATSAGVSVLIGPGQSADTIGRGLAGEPVGTLFAPVETRLEGRKRWLLSGLASRGRIVVDDGAVRALRERGSSLLAVGVGGVEGKFERGDSVDVVDALGNRIAYGVTNYSASDLTQITGCRSDQIAERLGYDYGSEVVHRNNLVVVD